MPKATRGSRPTLRNRGGPALESRTLGESEQRARCGPRYHLVDKVGYKSGDGLGVGGHGLRVPIMPRRHVTRLGNGARRHALSQVRDLNDGGCRSQAERGRVPQASCSATMPSGNTSYVSIPCGARLACHLLGVVPALRQWAEGARSVNCLPLLRWRPARVGAARCWSGAAFAEHCLGALRPQVAQRRATDPLVLVFACALVALAHSCLHFIGKPFGQKCDRLSTSPSLSFSSSGWWCLPPMYKPPSTSVAQFHNALDNHQLSA